MDPRCFGVVLIVPAEVAPSIVKAVGRSKIPSHHQGTRMFSSNLSKPPFVMGGGRLTTLHVRSSVDGNWIDLPFSIHQKSSEAVHHLQSLLIIANGSQYVCHSSGWWLEGFATMLPCRARPCQQAVSTFHVVCYYHKQENSPVRAVVRPPPLPVPQH